MELTLSVRSFHVPATPGTAAWPPSLPSVPTSLATRLTSDANPLSWSTIVLMVSLSSRISPFTSTVILRDKSPFAIAVATSAMFLTWPVRLLAMKFTLSVRSFQVPPTPGTCVQLIHHRVDGVFQFENFALHVHRNLARQVAAGHGRRYFRDVSNLGRE